MQTAAPGLEFVAVFSETYDTALNPAALSAMAAFLTPSGLSLLPQLGK
jgi:hypothetical protein